MPKGGLQFWHFVVVVLLAAMLGTALGDILGKALPSGPVGSFLAAGIRIGTSAPLDFDIKVAQITIGAALRLTVLGVLGAGVAFLLLLRRV